MTAEPTTPEPAFGSLGWRAGNALVGILARLGIGPIELLTTRGRRTGEPHTVPAVPVDHAGKRWLVAPYGPVAWVRNARTAGTVDLRHGRDRRSYEVREVPAQEAAPVLKRYVAVATKTAPRFRADKDAPADAFLADAERYPVFELTPRG